MSCTGLRQEDDLDAECQPPGSWAQVLVRQRGGETHLALSISWMPKPEVCWRLQLFCQEVQWPVQAQSLPPSSLRGKGESSQVDQPSKPHTMPKTRPAPKGNHLVGAGIIGQQKSNQAVLTHHTIRNMVLFLGTGSPDTHHTIQNVVLFLGTAIWV